VSSQFPARTARPSSLPLNRLPLFSSNSFAVFHFPTLLHCKNRPTSSSSASSALSHQNTGVYALFPSPIAEPTRQERIMTLSKFGPQHPSANRCSHKTPTGRRCRLIATSSASGLCPRHASRASGSPASDDLSASFPTGLDEFMSAIQINAFLSQLAALVVQDRISPAPRRRARLHSQPSAPHPSRRPDRTRSGARHRRVPPNLQPPAARPQFVRLPRLRVIPKQLQ